MIRNCDVLTDTFTVVERQWIAINAAHIVEIGDPGNMAPKYTPNESIDADGKLCMHGLVDGHTHTCQQLLRGRTMDEFPMIWSRILVPFESNLTEEDVRISAEASCLEMIKSGTVAFIDAGGIHMQRVADTVLESGMRAALTSSSMDIGEFLPKTMKRRPREIFDTIEDLYATYQGAGDGRLDVWFGIRQVMSCSPELIEEAASLARYYNTGLHAHLAEHRDEVRYCLEHFKKRPVEYLESLDALGPNLVSAHSVALSERELERLRAHDVKIVHCPRANYNSHGFPKTPTMLALGSSIGLGTDGASLGNVSLFEEMHIFRFGMQAKWGLPAFDPVVLPAEEVIKMPTSGSADALQRNDIRGTVKEGNIADIILVDMDQPHLGPTNSIVNTLAYSVTSHDVRDVIINGDLVMRDREVLTLDEERIKYESRLQQRKIIERAGI